MGASRLKKLIWCFPLGLMTLSILGCGPDSQNPGSSSGNSAPIEDEVGCDYAFTTYPDFEAFYSEFKKQNRFPILTMNPDAASGFADRYAFSSAPVPFSVAKNKTYDYAFPNASFSFSFVKEARDVLYEDHSVEISFSADEPIAIEDFDRSKIDYAVARQSSNSEVYSCRYSEKSLMDIRLSINDAEDSGQFQSMLALVKDSLVYLQ
jgi:hypothetical protein